jgi:hypothetical protein
MRFKGYFGLKGRKNPFTPDESLEADNVTCATAKITGEVHEQHHMF